MHDFIMDILLIPIGVHIALFSVVLISLHFIENLFKLLITLILIIPISYLIFPTELSKAIVATSYLSMAILTIYQLYNIFYGHTKYPSDLNDINKNDIKLSTEGLKILNDNNEFLAVLKKEQIELESLNLPKNKDGTYSQRSKAGKKANSLKDIINNAETNKAIILSSQFSYQDHWCTYKKIKYFANTILFFEGATCISLLYFFNQFKETNLFLILKNTIIKNANMYKYFGSNTEFISILGITFFVILLVIFLFAFVALILCEVFSCMPDLKFCKFYDFMDKFDVLNNKDIGNMLHKHSQKKTIENFSANVDTPRELP